MEIIGKKKKLESPFPKRGDKVVLISKQRPISRENRGEWRMERRVKKLQKMGYRPENIAAMMYTKTGNIRVRHVEKMLKHKTTKGDMDLSGSDL